MENLLIMGINTRPMVNSALKLKYNTFSVSYFKTLDFIEPFNSKHILHQELAIGGAEFNCGTFEENFSSFKLLDLAEEYLDVVDKIIFTTGISANDFKGKFSKFKNKIYGNLNTEITNDKFKFYNKIKNKFNVPLTFKPVDVDEVVDITKQYNDNQFILKPLDGSGGVGTFLLNNDTFNDFNKSNFESIILDGSYLMQEYISGVNLSSSVLSTNSESKNIINTRLLTGHDFNIKDNFVYFGNILPLTYESFIKFNPILKDNTYKIDNFNLNLFKNNFDKINENMSLVSQDLISSLDLIGSNGVDFILSEDSLKSRSSDFDENDLYVIEVNPRFQGTYECCEDVLGINMLDAHIKACEGELIEIPKLNNSNLLYSIKKIIYAENNIKVNDLNISNVYDIPYKNVKIEKNQPIVTILNSNSDLDLLIQDLDFAENKINKNIKFL